MAYASPPVAQLRVYESIDALTPVERIQADAAIERGRALGRGEVVAIEEAVAKAQLATGPMSSALERAVGMVEIRRVGQRVHVCPLLLERRVASAVVVSSRELPAAVSDELFGPSVTRAAERILQHVDRRVFVRDQAWFVPIHWLAAVAPEERHVSDHPEGAGPGIRFLTQISPARRRLARVSHVLEGLGDPRIREFRDEIGRLGIWMRAFDDHAIVELDYGRIAGLLGEDWRDERTCEQLQAAVAAVEDGDAAAAAAAYEAVRATWSDLWTRTREN